MAPATHQPAPSGTKGNASRQLAVVVVFGRRVAPAPWRLTFETLTSWVVLNVGGSGLAVGAVPQATCRACDSALVVLPPARRPAGRDASWRFIMTKISVSLGGSKSGQHRGRATRSQPRYRHIRCGLRLNQLPIASCTWGFPGSTSRPPPATSSRTAATALPDLSGLVLRSKQQQMLLSSIEVLLIDS
jgi:hypothetical protein